VIRSILGVVAGMIVGGIVVGIVEIPGYFIHPPPPGLTMSDTAAASAHFARAPLAALLLVALAWTLGPFVGAWLAGVIVRRAFVVHGLVIGAIFALLDISNLFAFPHPLWLAIVGIVAPFVAGWAGATVASRMAKPQPAGPKPYNMRDKNMAC
jgi:uncharacterized protein YacL